MSRTLVGLNHDLAVQVAIVNTRPSSASDGVDISHWRANGFFAPPLAAMFLDGSTTLTLSSPTGGARGVELYGWSAPRSRWSLIGYINDGADVDIASAILGYAQEVNILGIFTRLAIAGTVSAGTASAEFAPIDHWTGA